MRGHNSDPFYDAGLGDRSSFSMSSLATLYSVPQNSHLICIHIHVCIVYMYISY